jgi:H+/Cl- antiporter ClcA
MDYGRVLLLWLHVAAMMIAFAGLPIAGIIFRVIVVYVDEQSMLQMLATAFGRVFAADGISVGVGVVSGLFLAHTYGYTSSWLVLSYVLSAIAALIGILIDETWSKRLAAADRQNLPLVRSAALPRLAAPVGIVLWLSILWLMVAKPIL